ncbi:helix-turn-helix domain-containing protein [Bacillus sp. DJP31]|uniref:helix-turn-helix domain-containing protein n=1 Tax=Bacillus sp. DJP31 TaxID=3409789 RepID=UPI003BB5428A
MDGKKIKELRLRRGISLTELSKISGVSKSYLSFIERGKQKNPSIDVLEKLAVALGVDVYSLIDKKDFDQSELAYLDKEVLDLALEMTRAKIDKEKLRKLIEILR